MKAHPFSILQPAGWVPFNVESKTSNKKSKRKAVLSRTKTVRLDKKTSYVTCDPIEMVATFHICKRGRCEDYVVPYADEESLTKLAAMAD